MTNIKSNPAKTGRKKVLIPVMWEFLEKLNK